MYNFFSLHDLKAKPLSYSLLGLLIFLTALVMIQVELPLLLHTNSAWEHKIAP